MPEQIWIILVKKLNKEANATELQLFKQYCIENPEFKETFEELLEFWSVTNEGTEEPLLMQRHLERLKAADPDFSLSSINNDTPIASDTKGASFFFLYRKYLSLAAASIVLFLLGLWGFLYEFKVPGNFNLVQKQKVVNEVQTRAGSRSKLVLPDGTQVWVNSNTQLSYDPDFGDEHRMVTLNGEAYFIVQENKDIPFEIETKSIKIKVTGTTFNVRAYDDETKTETSLFQGSVTISHKSNPKKEYILKPQDKLVVDNLMEKSGFNELLPQKNGLPQVKQEVNNFIRLQKIAYDPIDSIAMETAWVYSRLAFNDESFEELVQKMEKWYGVNIVFETEALKGIRFTGKFKTETVQEALEALQFTSNFNFRRNDNQIIIY